LRVLWPVHSLVAENGNFESGNRRFGCRFGRLSCRFRKQVWTGLYESVWQVHVNFMRWLMGWEANEDAEWRINGCHEGERDQQ